MKRLALLLAAMGIVSAAAFAEAPVLKVTSIGQELEVENDSGAENIGDSVFFGTMVNLSYGDWTFGLTGAKFWSVDTKDGFDSVNSRLQFDIGKSVTDNLRLTGRYRGQKDYDRYQVGYSYADGMLWSSGDFWYNANTDEAIDNFEAEWFPVGVQYGIFKAGWFVNYWKALGSFDSVTDAGKKDEYIEHQVRLYATLYQGEKLTVSTEARITLTADGEYEGGDKATTESLYKDFGRNRLYLGANYAVTESLTVYGKYGYEIRDKEYVATGKDDKSNNYYGDLILGWNYKF